MDHSHGNDAIGVFIIIFTILIFVIHFTLSAVLFKLLRPGVKAGWVTIAEHPWTFGLGSAMLLFVSMFITYVASSFITAIIALSNGWFAV